MSIVLFNRHTAKFVIPVLFAAAISTPDANAQGSILVTPGRVVFEKQTSIKEVTVANTSNEPATVIIMPKQYRMKEDGAFEEITTPDEGQKFATDHLRYFPKKVTLAPKKSQTIKIEVVNREGMDEGEYRSYLNFKTEPKKSANNVTIDEKGISATLVPAFGITIPVIIKSGNLDATVRISETSLNTDNKLNLVFNRKGNASVYGDLIVEHVASNGQVTKLSTIKGIAIYTPNTTRHFTVDLSKENANLSEGMLKVVYKAHRDENGKILAATELKLK
jgi:P pilus assembly chaperone PapD